MFPTSLRVSGFFLAALLSSAIPVLSQSPHILPPSLPQNGFAIAKWRVVGPWRYDPHKDPAAMGLAHDYLAAVGPSENGVTAEAFSKTMGSVLVGGIQSFDKESDSYTKILQLASQKRPVDYAVAYLGALIDSPVEQEAGLAIGVDDSCKVWLNQELVHADSPTAARGIARVEILTGVHLKKGQNFLLVKTENKTGDWQLIATLFPHSRLIDLARENAVNTLIENRIVAAGMPLTLRGDLAAPAKHGLLQILDNVSGKVILERQTDLERHFAQPTASLQPEAVYRCRVSFAGQSLEETFYYGDPATALRRARERAAPFLTTNDVIAVNLDAQFRRLDHLMLPGNVTTAFWDQKILWSLGELEDILARLQQQKPAYQAVAGTHLRGFRSKIDGNIQHYWLHVPEKSINEGKPIPIVIAMPYTTGSHLPFVKSYFLAAFDEDERYRLLGEQFGMAVLQPWGRGNHSGDTAIGMTDVFEALEAVKQDYKIDLDRVYLAGYCEGGRLALLLGEEFPDRFAAVAVEGPITRRPSRFGFSQAWDRFVSPINMAESLVTTPVFIEHEQRDTIPINDSVGFQRKGQAAGAQITLVAETGGFHGFYQDPMDIKRKLFAFFDGKQRKVNADNVILKTGRTKFASAYWLSVDELSQPMKMATVEAHWQAAGKIDLHSENVDTITIHADRLPQLGLSLSISWNDEPVYSGKPAQSTLTLRPKSHTVAPPSSVDRPVGAVHGPLLEAFGDAVLIVKGHHGSPEENAGVDRLAGEICATWERNFFVDCPAKLDGEVTEDEMKQRNLVLIGDASLNSIVARLAGKIPLSSSPAGITIAGNTFPGAHLGYELAYPNPLNVEKYVVLIGATQMAGVPAWRLDLSRDGVCDYFIVQLSGSKLDLSDAGYFDRTWSQIHSVLSEPSLFAPAKENKQLDGTKSAAAAL